MQCQKQQNLLQAPCIQENCKINNYIHAAPICILKRLFDLSEKMHKRQHHFCLISIQNFSFLTNSIHLYHFFFEPCCLSTTTCFYLLLEHVYFKFHFLFSFFNYKAITLSSIQFLSSNRKH